MKNNVFKLVITTFLCICMVFFTACGDEKNIENKDSNVLISDAVLSECSYSLGDKMGDYTVTDVNGNEYVFSELLKSKKAIVLNFWYVNCGPCQMEFPFLQAAADKYSDDVVVLAINPTDDRENDIQKYATKNELSIPLIKGDLAWNTAFSIRGFPTTVVIDRYGIVSFSHMGAVVEEGVFEKLFAHFSADDYTQKIVESLDDIK